MTDLKKDILRIQKKYPKLTFGSQNDARDFVNIYNILEHTYDTVDPILLLNAYVRRNEFSLKTANDYYYLVTSTVVKNTDIKKKAYPIGSGGFYENPIEEADLSKWVSLVHKIYKAVDQGGMSFRVALDYYSRGLNSESGESERFKKWVIYYKNGEHQKYAMEQKMNIKKESDFQFGLNSTPYGRSTIPSENSVSDEFEKLENSRKKEESFEAWKSKVNGAIRRIDKLLRDDVHLTPEEQSDLADMLHSFDLQMRRVRMQSTASDISHRASDQFRKIGYRDISNILKTVAQELEDVPVATPEMELEAPEVPLAGPTNDIEAEVPAAASGPAETIGRALTKGESTDLNSETSTSSEGQINFTAAAVKLEDVAARLADRRTIRQLAEFDIMLDKLGIASLFPELAEAQSKLIDAYSYALVRVTKMLGMLSSGRTMSEVSEAKKTDISNKAIKDVNKTLTQGEEPIAGKGTEALNEEFGETPAPAKIPQPELMS